MRTFQELLINQMTIKDRDIVFDMDGTLIEGDIGETIYLHSILVEFMSGDTEIDWLKPKHPDSNNHVITLSEEGEKLIIDYRNQLLSGNFDKAYINTAERLVRYERKDLEPLVQAFLKEEKSAELLRFQRSNNGRIERFNMAYGAQCRREMVALVDFFNQQGANLWIVSASPQIVCEIVADRYQIDKNNVLGTCVSDQGKKSPRFPWGQKKLEILLEAGVTHPLFVFGDGEGDIEMLEIAEYPVVVEGNSRKIIEYANKMNWWIL